MEIIISLLTLLFLEIVLGIDNLIFVSLAASHLPKAQQPSARNFGLILALFTRLILLASANWMAHFTAPLFTLENFDVSGRDLLLGFGGLFLMFKGTLEIHEAFRLPASHTSKKTKPAQTFLTVILQIAFLDIIFSLDSVIT